MLKNTASVAASLTALFMSSAVAITQEDSYQTRIHVSDSDRTVSCVFEGAHDDLNLRWTGLYEDTTDPKVCESFFETMSNVWNSRVPGQ